MKGVRMTTAIGSIPAIKIVEFKHALVPELARTAENRNIAIPGVSALFN